MVNIDQGVGNYFNFMLFIAFHIYKVFVFRFAFNFSIWLFFSVFRLKATILAS